MATTHNNKKMLANHQKSNDFVFKASGNQDGGEIEKEDGGEKQMSKEDEEVGVLLLFIYYRVDFGLSPFKKLFLVRMFIISIDLRIY